MSAPHSRSDAPSYFRPSSPTLGWTIFILAALAYLLPGIFGHGPWKQDETYSFGIIHTMLETGRYLVPTNAGEPFMEKPPLYYWTAVLFAKLFSPWLGFHDGARVASLFYTAVSGVFITKTAMVIWKKDTIFYPEVLATLALFASTMGMVRHAHDMFTDVALVTGGVIAFYGLLTIIQNTKDRTPSLAAPFWFGMGVGIALMSKGLFLPILYTGTAILVAVCIKECRTLAYARMVGIAVLVSLPFFLIWPALLAQHSMPLFMKWFWDNNVGRFLGFSVSELGAENNRFLFWSAPFTFLLPTAPLALLAFFYKEGRQLRAPHIAIAVIFSVLCLTLLGMSASGRHLYYLPLAFPFALLAIPVIAHLPVKVAAVWDWCSRIIFGGLGLLLWAVYIVSMMPLHYHHWLAPLQKWLPLDFITPLQPLALIAAIALTVGWLWTLPRLKHVGQWRGVFSWFANITFMWGITMTALLPWIDYSKSYEYTYRTLSDKITPEWRADDCMASMRLGESEAPTLSYYVNIEHQPLRDASTTSCNWLIVQDFLPHYLASISRIPADQSASGTWVITDAAADTSPVYWSLFWTGGRDGDTGQALRVFKRITPVTP